jgi:hypothetical protein
MEKGGTTMSPRLPKLLLGAAAGAYLLGAAGSVLAAPDHLKCYKAREVAGPGKFTRTGDLLSSTSLANQTGCLIKGPAKLVCAPVTKTNVSPPAPGGGPTAAAKKFICYKLKCPKIPDQSLTLQDQFGTHTFTIRTAKTLCAPASPSGAFLDDSSAF